MKIVIVAPFSQRDLMARQFYYRIFQGMQAAVGEWAQTPVQTAAEAGQRGLPIEITFRPTPAGPTGIASPADARQVGLLVQDLNADATVDAVALLGIADPALLAGLAALAKPVVLIDSAWPAGATPVDKVRLENAGGVRAAVEHLIQLGHRSIGLLNFVPDTQAARERREVYLATLAAAGLPAPAAGVVAVELTGTAAFGAMRPRLAAERQRAAAARITAWFCSSDELAAGLMAAAQDCGLNIPGDLSVVGFGDLGQFVWPPLSSVRIAMEEMGRRAVGLCVGRWLDRSVSAQEVVVPGELVVRGTSGVGGM